MEGECARQREQYVQRPWGMKEPDLSEEEKEVQEKKKRSPGNWEEWSVSCSHAFVEGSMDFILSVIGSYLRVLGREVT